ncbi:YbaK/EbsC family protein [Nicoliella lavandulae]|uniref:YbaK/EbsC family protein n=1 Tax=Nicoliella lavandulae TaxID=3082954 RepID=A0ABU8SN76_9LACO
MNQDLKQLFNNLEIPFKLVEHQPIYTIQDAQNLNLDDNVLEIKNLFLHNQNKSKYYLFSMPANLRIPLKELASMTNDKHLSFVSEPELMDKLGTYPGSVSILNAVNDHDKSVIYYVAKSILQNHHVAYHPNQNDQTIIFDGNRIKDILNGYQFKSFEG